ncbi:MAG: HPr family phosphocarrier protein [Alphaproteobacteria bacterium]
MSDEPSAAREVAIVNQKGLHLRAAAKLVSLADTFDARIEISRNEMIASGHDILSLMMLAASQHSTVVLRATGHDAETAIDALAGLIAAGFYESD